ncbi:MAG: cysteine desulfurase [Rhodothermia bacterium]|nr:MAG: cysteine desulfurase [Rhodothermia bacterium]
MKRRSFIKNLSTGIGSLALLPGLAPEIPDRLTRLTEELAAMSTPDDLWKRVRKEFQFNPGVVHFNSATLGATPRLVLDAMSSYVYKLEGNPAVNMFGWGGSQMEEVRAKAADFIGAKLEEVAFTRNTTEGMNAIADGLDLKAGDQILTTNHEHGGGMVGWQNLRKKLGVEIVYAKMPRFARSKQQLVDLIAERITPKTRVCSLSHIDTITGVRMPLPEISVIMREKDIILVGDGAQAPGQIQVDVSVLGVDAYAYSAHKWFLGPKGSGVLYIRKETQDRIRPTLLYSGYSSYSASSGTRNAAHIMGQRVTIEFHDSIGRDKIEDRCRELSGYLRTQLVEMPELTIMTPENPELSCGIVTCTLNKGKNSEIVARMRDEHGIILKAAQGTYAYSTEDGLDRENYNAIRFSTHIFNSKAEIDHVTARLGEMFAEF